MSGKVKDPVISFAAMRVAYDLALSGRAKVLGEKITRKANPLTASDAVSFAEEKASPQEGN